MMAEIRVEGGIKMAQSRTPDPQAPAHARLMQQQFGVLGGTFDPIHIGHLIVAQEAVSALHLDRLFFLPAGDPPHKHNREVTPAHHRVRMVELAIADNPAFELSLVDVERPGPSFTVDTLRLLRERWGPDTAISFIIGWDMLDDLSTWRDPVGVVRQVHRLVAVHRPGYELSPQYLSRLEEMVPGINQRLAPLEAPQIAISSTELRRRVASGRPIRYQVPDAVERYILAQGLYRQLPTEAQGKCLPLPHPMPG
jgi:nicotinate-nucleotide adenylyltransferase